MKLFVTNKRYFEETFDNPERFINTNREPLTTRQMHKLLYNELSISIDTKYAIPICILVPYDNGEGSAIFDFVTKKDSVYYYEYSTTAS
jgi:hypothetical protein